MRSSRHRYYGHPQLISFIERLAAEADRMGGGILIGDMALPRGGPMPTGHRSHQIGLDVDIWFLPAPLTLLTPVDREEVSAISMVASDGQSVDPMNWTPWQATLLEQAALDPRVDRILSIPRSSVPCANPQPPTAHGCRRFDLGGATTTTSMSVSCAPRAKMPVFRPSPCRQGMVAMHRWSGGFRQKQRRCCNKGRKSRRRH